MARNAKSAEEPSFLDVTRVLERRYLDRKLEGDEFLMLALCFYTPPDNLTKEEYLIKTMGEDTYRTLRNKMLDRYYCPSCDIRLLIAPTLVGDSEELVCQNCGYVKGDYLDHESIVNTVQSMLSSAGVPPPTPGKVNEYVDWIKKEVSKIGERKERKEPTDVTKAYRDEWLTRNEKFIEKMLGLLSALENRSENYFDRFDPEVNCVDDEKRYGTLVKYFMLAKKDIISDAQASRSPNIPIRA